VASVGGATRYRRALALQSRPAWGATVSLEPFGEPATSRLRSAAHDDVLHLPHNQIAGGAARAELERALNVARVEEGDLDVRLRRKHGVRDLRVASHGCLLSCSSSLVLLNVGGSGEQV
jgi:hypothetical protein